MFVFSIISIGLLSLAQSVSAHGYLKSIEVGGKSYLAWQVGQDDYVTPEPARYARRIKDNGPVPDFTSVNITCNQGGNIPSKATVPVNAGDKVKLIWDQWGSSHSGPVMNYLASCGSSCATFKGDTGTPWVKFDQMAYDTTKSPPWGSDFLATQGASWTVTIPASLKPGEYLLRHEILGLHVAGDRMGAQFYPACVQIKVSGSGTKSLPAGVGLPGAYNPDDAGILVQLWQVNQGQRGYTAPGGPVKTI
ncbi:glycoside hydrolase [Boeremia exigua]|uniref:glycoside hydrolase n=1 Tax=Boeremia exigua TaxID=749465 RepID=UPI001E8D79CC|nr:glycoside hydrolase [Boeremia exigua]KAH6633802.1 glycoside hydrolase [Boeremia exigua]